MSAPRVDRLQALLARVQQNRTKPRNGVEAKSATEDVVVEFEEEAEADSTPPPPPPAPKRPAHDRRATPLEMALSGELDREIATRTPAEAGRPAAAAEPARPAAAAEPRVAPPAVLPPQPSARAPRPATQPIVDSPTAPIAITPIVIEPEPPRELARPIAQVVSKHAQAVDATFGALLKRSLSLRPH